MSPVSQIAELKALRADLINCAKSLTQDIEAIELQEWSRKQKLKDEARKEKLRTALRLRSQGKTYLEISQAFGCTSPDRGRQLTCLAERLWNEGKL